jgi:hypothetical protein
MKKISVLVLVLALSITASAANPSQPFLPSDNIQDPGCTPADSNCYVKVNTFNNETVTGLDYATSTGVLSLTSGYVIPTVASTTAWNTSLSALAGNAIVQNGNSFGNTLSLGTNDNQSLSFKTNGTSRMSISSTGDVTVTGALSAGTVSGNGSSLSGLTTTQVAEGTSLYYTNARARSAVSSTVTGLTYASSTGVLSLTSGYEIPTTASTSQWNALVGGGNATSTAVDLASGILYSQGQQYMSLVGQTDINNSNIGNNVLIGINSGSSLVPYDDSSTCSNTCVVEGSGNFFVGNSAGLNVITANGSNFLGSSAGYGATNANNSNFLGNSAGYFASSAYNSNFLGNSAGSSATSAYYSNFLGNSAGNGATNANDSNFLGNSAGYGATSAYNSNFLGNSAGSSASSAYNSNFLGSSAGNGATNASDSNFLGSSAGYGATSAYNSNFLGNSAGSSASSAYNSNFLGNSAGNGATIANDSNFLGYSAGNGATNAYYSNFLGNSAGNGATSAYNSNFLGNSAGNGATNASDSNFLGSSAGSSASSAYNSNFLGNSAGNGATNASDSNFLGSSAGNGATNASDSNFLGSSAGYGAASAYDSNFLGSSAGYFASSAANSIFIGNFSGFNDIVDNTSNNGTSIAIGRYSGTGGFSNSIALGHGVKNSAVTQLNIGNVLYGTGIYNSDTQSAAPISGGKLGIGTSTPQDTLQAFGDIRSGTSGSNGCIKNYAGTGIAGTCSSDERLKTDITDFATGTLDKVLALRTISYKWNDIAKGLNNVNTQVTNYGLLAQNVEQSFPELVTTDSNGYKQVNYSSVQLYILKAVQELAQKVLNFSESFTSKKITTQQLCVDDVCVTKEQFKAMLQNSNTSQIIIQQPVVSSPVITQDAAPATTTEVVATTTIATTTQIEASTSEPVVIPTVEASTTAQ